MNRLNRTLLTAAVAAVFSTGAFAQTRIDRSGATDANKRVGSDGRNITGGRANPWEISNRVVYGNITGGKAFRGATASTDPQAFRGPSASTNFDNFVRGSSGVTTGGIPTYNANQTRAYYGESRNVPAPAGFVGVPSIGGYTPPRPTNWVNADPRGQALSSGDTSAMRAPNDPNISGGPVDTVYAPNALPGNPIDPNGLPGQGELSDYTNLNTNTVNQLTPGQIKQIQGEEPQSRLPGQTPQDGTTNNVNTDAQPQQVNPTGNPVNNAGPLNASPDNAPGSTAGATVGAEAGVGAGAVPLNSSVTPADMPEMGTVTRVRPKAGERPPVGRPEPIDATTPKRPGQAAEDAAREYNARLRDTNQPDGEKPAEGEKPADPKPADAQPAEAAANAGGPPPKISTFAGAATAQGLNEMLTKAEGQMKEGKYASAIDTYGAAEAVAPRNATLKLGRANAELGGAYYRRAEASLRQAFVADGKLLQSQYDLRGFLGDERLQTVQKDLSDLVQNRDKDTGAAVLLAYVYYNTGNERRAQALLDLADKRAGGRDTLVRAMKAGWTFGGADETK